MKANKRNQRSAIKRKKRIILKQKLQSDRAQQIRTSVNKLMSVNETETDVPSSNIGEAKLLWYIGRCKAEDAYPPWVMGVLLGHLHWSKINFILEQIGFQHPKVVGERRSPTMRGSEYYSKPSSSGLKWKFSAINCISEQYSIPIDMPTPTAIANAQVHLSHSIKLENQ